MPALAANISLLFPDLPFPDRIAAAAQAGFRAVECQFPYDWPVEDLRARLAAADVEMILLNTPPGDFRAGERGLAALPGREEDFRAALERAVGYARGLGCSRIHVMAGIAQGDAAAACYLANLAWAADRLASVDMMACIEPLNQRDFPGYFLAGSRQAEQVITAVGRANLRLQFDTYHLQILEGDLITTLRRLFPLIGHIQIASVPDRDEPDRGEVDHTNFLAELDRLHWQGWVGAEYRPSGDTVAGLGWAARYGVSAAL